SQTGREQLHPTSLPLAGGSPDAQSPWRLGRAVALGGSQSGAAALVTPSARGPAVVRVERQPRRNARLDDVVDGALPWRQRQEVAAAELAHPPVALEDGQAHPLPLRVVAALGR